MAEVTLGQLPERGQKRDAVHVAILPVVAGESLEPGEHVGEREDGTIGKGSESPFGIVDPFLRRAVKQGDAFWCCMYPGSIAGLRHDWIHSALDFIDGEPVTTASGSYAWIQAYAATVPVDPADLMDAADTWVESKKAGRWGEYWIEGGRFEGVYLPEEFWEHYQRVRGVDVPEDQRGDFYSCSC